LSQVIIALKNASKLFGNFINLSIKVENIK
jgi:hypothetical protein